MSANQIREVRKTAQGAAYGILVQTPNMSGVICGNAIEQPNGQATLSAHISLESAAARRSFNICYDNFFAGPSQAAVKSPR